MAKKIEYTAKDCLDVCNEKQPPGINDEFLNCLRQKSQSIYLFGISKKDRDKESEPVVYFDYNTGSWKAGRYIGNVECKIGKQQYSLSITPRFGEKILFEMFGEIFNVKFSGDSSGLHADNKNFYIRMFVSFIWLQKLAKACRHGLPESRVSVINKGYSVKGHLLAKPSAFSYMRDKTIISESSETVFDKKIIAILTAAYKILKSDYAFEKLSISPEQRRFISEIEKNGHSLNINAITEKDYKSVSYRPIYQSFKDIVDFSWQIIKSETGLQYQKKDNNVSGYLIDMAEVWECYIRSLLDKKFRAYGWESADTEITVYEDVFFKRKLIPDIVFRKGGSYCVFDAKYKKMAYRKNDVDREDFFQIHTYISCLQQRGRVKAAGLLYPAEKASPDIKTSSALFGCDNNCLFFADGPQISDGTVNTESFIKKLEAFLENA